MHRVLLLFFLFAFESYSDSSTHAGLVWLENPSCGGILIEPDIVLSLNACLGSKTEVVWPYRSQISYSVRHLDSKLAILVLVRDLPDPVELIRTSELSHLKQMMPIHFSNLEQSIANWIDTLGNTTFTAFYGPEPALIGSPVWTELEPGGLRAVGMITGEKTAIRLESYFNFINTQVKLAHERKPKTVPESTRDQGTVIFPGVTVVPKHIVTLPAEVVSVQIEASVIPAAAPLPVAIEPEKIEPSQPAQGNSSSPAKPPVSLGCSCSQVRR